MFCTNCGYRLEEGDMFCPNCGQRVEVTGGFAEKEMFYDDPQPQEMYISEPTFANQGDSDTESRITNYIIAAAGGIGFSWIAVAVLRLLTVILRLVGSIMPYIPPIYSVLNFVFMLVYYVKTGLVWLLIVGSIAVIGGLIYMLSNQKYSLSKQMILIGIIDSALVLLASILYLVHPGYGVATVAKVFMYISAIASVVLGIDLFLNVFVEKKSLRGKFNLADDLAIIKDKISKPSVVVDTSHYTDRNIPQYEMTEQHEALDSYFDGQGGELFVKWLLMFLVSLVTCGIAAPIMIHKIIKWRVEHTVIEGRRLAFNGTAGQFYLLILKWILLSIVTCGVYAYLEFPVLGYYRWAGSHTAFEDAQKVNQNGEFIDSFFDGNIAETIGYMQLYGIITTFTCGLGFPWGYSMLSRWEKKSSVISRKRLFFDGDGSSLFGEYILVWLLSLITCGIYYPWGMCKIERYIINHTHIDSRWTM